MKNCSFLILAFLFSFTLTSSAQESSLAPHHKNIYLEFLGSGLAFSAHFDMRLQRGVQDGLGFRAGVGGFSETGYTDGQYGTIGIVTMPVGINYLIGERRGSFEAGAGLTLLYARAEVSGMTEWNEVDGWGVAGFLNMGYRLQPLKNGFMMRINWSPAITQNGFHAGWFGLSLGLGFK